MLSSSWGSALSLCLWCMEPGQHPARNPSQRIRANKWEHLTKWDPEHEVKQLVLKNVMWGYLNKTGKKEPTGMVQQCVCVYIYVYVCMHVCVCMCVYVWVCVYTHTNIYTSISISISQLSSCQAHFITSHRRPLLKFSVALHLLIPDFHWLIGHLSDIFFIIFLSHLEEKHTEKLNLFSWCSSLPCLFDNESDRTPKVAVCQYCKHTELHTSIIGSSMSIIRLLSRITDCPW